MQNRSRPQRYCGGVSLKISKKALLYSAGILAISNMTLQLLGMAYRVLLSRLTGAEGMGVYQLVMSAYPVLISITMTGLCLATSRIAAQRHALGDRAGLYRLMQLVRLLFLLLFAVTAGGTVALARPIAEGILGDARTQRALILLLPCLFFTGFENLYKSYFFGTKKIRQPITSEITEQVVRFGAVAALLVYFGPSDPGQAAALIVIGMIISEVVSSSMLRLFYGSDQRRNPPLGGRQGQAATVKAVMAIALPVSASELLSSLIGSAHTVMIPQRLMVAGVESSRAISLLGIMMGMSWPLLMLPAGLIGSLVRVLVPKLSEGMALGHGSDTRRKAAKALHVTGLLTFPAVAALMALGPAFCAVLYRQPEAGQYLLPLAPAAVFIYYQISTLGILNGIGLQSRAAVHAVAGGLLELVVTWFMAGDPRFGVWGVIAGFVAGGALPALLNFYWVVRGTGLKVMWVNWLVTPAVAAGFGGYAALLCHLWLAALGVGELVALILSMVACFATYLAFLWMQGLDMIRYLKTLRP